MTRVLLTCPPMLGIIDEYRSVFAAKSIELETPKILQTMPEAELIRRLPEFDGWIIGDDPASAAVLEAGVKGKLRAAVRWGVGTDNVDFAAAERLGLKIVNTPGVFGREVADIAMNYVSGLARETFRIDREVRMQNAWPKPIGISLAGKTVALVGFGDIGRQTAKRLCAAEMRVLVYDPLFKPAEGIEAAPRLWPAGLDEADFLVFTCPLTSSTKGMFNTALLAQLKPGVRVVNVGRGPIIDESALLEGLAHGVVHSAALDVFETEPLPATSPLRGYDRCIFGSHNASNTLDAVRKVSSRAVEILFGYLGVA